MGTTSKSAPHGDEAPPTDSGDALPSDAVTGVAAAAALQSCCGVTGSSASRRHRRGGAATS